MDTHYLLAVRDHLHTELTERGLVQEAYETFIDACNVPVPASEFDPEGYWRLGIPASLSRREMAILREVYLLRDSLARERDVPSFKVFNDEVLVALAEAAPTYYGDLKNIRGLSAGQVGRYGNALIEAVQRGKNAPSPKPPQRPPDIDPLIVERFSALRDWRRRRAEERGVESDVIVSKHTLWEVARRLPGQVDDLHDIPGLGPWRLATYGEELISVLRRFNGGL
jgi:ribonuclease D